MIRPDVQRALLGKEPADIGTPVLRLFQVVATGEIVSYPRHFLWHPAFIGTIVPWPTATGSGGGYGSGGYGEGGYGTGSSSNKTSSTRYPGATNYPGPNNYPGV